MLRVSVLLRSLYFDQLPLQGQKSEEKKKKTKKKFNMSFFFVS
jgi:hypothetical protein